MTQKSSKLLEFKIQKLFLF